MQPDPSFLDVCFAGPMWPASLLLLMLAGYLVIALLGMVDIGQTLGADVDLDVDADVDLDPGLDVDPGLDGGIDGGVDGDLGGDAGHHADFLGGAGGMTIRWLNLDGVPLMIWGATFTVILWITSFTLWTGYDSQTAELTTVLLLIARNAVLAIVATKFLTNPLNQLLAPGPSYEATKILGQTAAIDTSTADARFGRVKFITDGSPLLLDVRTQGVTLAKGTVVELIAYDPKKHIYTVRPIAPIAAP